MRITPGAYNSRESITEYPPSDAYYIEPSLTYCNSSHSHPLNPSIIIVVAAVLPLSRTHHLRLRLHLLLHIHPDIPFQFLNFHFNNKHKHLSLFNTTIFKSRNSLSLSKKMEDSSSRQGTVTCASWIRRPENAHLVVVGKARHRDQPSLIEIFSFDSKTSSLASDPLASHVIEEGDPVSIAVHPSGDDFVCSTTTGGCKLFEVYGRKMLAKEFVPLQGAGFQKCLAFSVDGSKFASGGEDGHLRIFEWPSLRVILDEPRAHKSFQDMDFSLDSEFLATTSTDGSARIWKTNDGVPVTSLTRNSDEKIELCRFSKDGTKPFLFCTVQKGNKALTVVWDISEWKKIGHKRLLRKPASVMSMSLDGKYLALGSKDGDVCVVELKKMEISHWSKRLHLGSRIASLEFCPSERIVLTTSKEWGAMATKLNVPADWKEWQVYLVLLGLFLASAVAFYIFFENSDSFWNFPLGRDQPAKPRIEAIFGDPQSDDQNMWSSTDHLDL